MNIHDRPLLAELIAHKNTNIFIKQKHLLPQQEHFLRFIYNNCFETGKTIKTITIMQKLLGSSANCKFSVLTVHYVTQPAQSKSFFLKFQVKESADDIMIDNAHGKILNNLAKEIKKIKAKDPQTNSELLKSSFTTYIDSFETFIKIINKNQYEIDLDRLLSHQPKARQAAAVEAQICKLNIQNKKV